jgi:uncharacterized membrane protein YphA (DoxX/SURF4 family)
MDNAQHITSFIGHILIGSYFVFFGFWNMYHWVPMTETMIKHKFACPLLLLSFIIGFQIIMGVMLIFGILVKLTALTLIPFIFAIVMLLHPFWKYKSELRKQHMALFVTNLTMCLGAMFLMLG